MNKRTRSPGILCVFLPLLLLSCVDPAAAVLVLADPYVELNSILNPELLGTELSSRLQRYTEGMELEQLEIAGLIAFPASRTEAISIAEQIHRPWVLFPPLIDNLERAKGWREAFEGLSTRVHGLSGIRKVLWIIDEGILSPEQRQGLYDIHDQFRNQTGMSSIWLQSGSINREYLRQNLQEIQHPGKEDLVILMAPRRNADALGLLGDYEGKLILINAAQMAKLDRRVLGSIDIDPEPSLRDAISALENGQNETQIHPFVEFTAWEERERI